MSSLAVFGASAQVRNVAPQEELSSGTTRIKVYLPDAAKGFYRGTRFDWSGVIGELDTLGHTWFDQWFTRGDATVHDFSYDGSDIVAGPCTAATGPVEEFTTPLGYDEAKPGGTFVKIGVGVLRRPDDAKYDSFRLYEVVDNGHWQTRKKGNSIEFGQDIQDPSSGYSYSYEKTITVLQDKSGIVIDHRLTNTGKRSIKTDVYDHNFLVLDKQPPGPDFTITFPFQISPVHPPEAGLAELRGNQIVYLKKLTGEDRVFTTIHGFGDDAKDYDVRIDNARLGVGLTITGDRPLKNVAMWSIRPVMAVEPFIEISVNPGQSFTWRYEYAFHKLGSSGK
uniref:Uncharacterized protein n=2 Tax=Paracidobacterium acidisoli TaxID=2303751 RepID=A0A372ILE0_9BACT